ncbi:MAG: hypothetical protein QXK06_05100, partial [Candidatus Diapherotrites archaeon]
GTGDDGCGGTLNCGDCPTGQKCNIGTHKCEPESVPPTGTFTLLFYFDEIKREGATISDYDNALRCASWFAGKDLSTLEAKPQHEAVYKNLNQFFELREGSLTGTKLSCSVSGDYLDFKDAEGTQPYYVISCPGVKFNQSYAFIFKYKKADGKTYMMAFKMNVDGQGYLKPTGEVLARDKEVE